MPWAAIARVLEIVRWPVSGAVALVCAIALTRGPFRELSPVQPVVFVVGFVVALLVAVFVMTALLAFADHAADEDERKRKHAIELPTAIATYRPATPESPGSPEPTEPSP